MLAKDLPDHFGFNDGTEYYRFNGRVPHGLQGSCLPMAIMGSAERANKGLRYLLTIETRIGSIPRTTQYIIKEGEWISIHHYPATRNTYGEYVPELFESYLCTTRQMTELARQITHKEVHLERRMS